MADIVLTSEITVEEVQQVGSDEMIARAAWVSTGSDRATPDRVAGLLRFLMAHRHGSPFEHGSLTVRLHAPIKVWREWMRHRIGWSYSEASGRYRDLDPVFYVPPPGRPAIRPEGFRSARPAFDLPTPEEHAALVAILREGYQQAYDRYLRLLAMQVDRGLARDVLGVGIYSTCYCTANPRSLMAFLELRTDDPAARRPSKPLWEIEQAARPLEAIFAKHWPLTHAAWQSCGRMAP